MNPTAQELMTVTAARALAGHGSCFVGIGLPSMAANLARRVHNPDLVLIYESGTIGAKPTRLPLSIGDGELALTADSVVSVPEVFNYWLQPGRVDVGFLSAAQLDQFGNLNTTVIGGYDRPGVRLPGAGGAPEIATACREVILIVRQSKRAFVSRLDFVTTACRPAMLITDVGVLTPDGSTSELTLTSVHPGMTAEMAVQQTGWPLRVAAEVSVTEPPTIAELKALRELTSA